MKKLFYSFSLATVMTGILITGCQTASDKEADAKENVREAKEDLKDAQADANTQAQKIASAEEWDKFKSESNEKR